MISVFSPESQGKDGNIIDVAGFYKRRGDTLGNPVVIGHQFGLEPHDGLFFVVADIETDNRHGDSRAGSGINVLHPRDLPQQFFHRFCNTFFHLFWAGTRHSNKYVDHRDNDLGLFFPGEGGYCCQS